MLDSKRVYGVVVAAGSGKRMKSTIPKQLMKIGAVTVLEKTCRSILASRYIDELILVTSSDIAGSVKNIAAKIAMDYPKMSFSVIEGGAERQDSVYNGINYIYGKACTDYALINAHIEAKADDLILIHDGVRPFVDKNIVDEVIMKADDKGAALCGVEPKETVREKMGKTLQRENLVSVQTPQCFKAAVIEEAYRTAYLSGVRATDDAGIAEANGICVHVVDGSYDNIKITTRGDLPLEYRIGTGYDVHCLQEGRALIIGGVDIPYKKGLEGHSDADVLIHALIDAILGAAKLGDIGCLFPDTDEEYKNISSMILLERAWSKVRDAGYNFVNCDLVIICQEPKLRPYICHMEENIAKVIGTTSDRISIKATTTEKLGYEGRGEGISCNATCLLQI